MICRTLAALAVVAIAARSAQAQPTPSEPGSQLTVHLLTMGPGDQVWERFGHNAIWIHDEANHTDIAYNWGLFDFADKDFIPRFVQGRMLYSMGAFDFTETVDAYRRANRTVWSQELEMTPEEKQRLAEFVAWNIRPENRYYRYDYFRDNCSTRVRDAIDGALGGVIRHATTGTPSHTTYRFHTARLTQDDWPIFTGTMMGLGQPTDREISAWEEMFLPVMMKDRLKSVTVDRGGAAAPLAKNERVLFQATRPAEATEVHRGIIGYLLLAAGVLALGFALWKVGLSAGRRGSSLALGALWSVVAGLAGTLLAGLWGFTDHIYSYRNENVLQLNPLSLVVAVLLVHLIWKRRRSPSVAPSRALLVGAALVAALSVLGFLLQILPSMYQVNGDVIAFAMPLHLGLAAALFLLARQRIPSESAARV
ncbi:MAG: DUF4105 domain-containing protein [Gemmatimonadales bacterium]